MASDLLHLYEHAPAQREPADLRHSLVPMLDGLSRALGYQRALVALYDQERGTLRGTIGLNVPEAIAESLEVSLAARESPLVATLLDGMPQRVDDIYRDGRLSEPDRALLEELGMVSFVVVPLRRGVPGLHEPAVAVSRQPVSWQGRELPAVGVILLSKEDRPITDQDIEWLMPFATQAGFTLAHAGDVELLRSSSERYAIENEWLWLMLNAVDDPVIVTDAENRIIKQNRRAELFFRAAPEDSEGKRHAIEMNNFFFTAWLSAWTLDQGTAHSRPELTLVDPIEGTEVVFEVISYPATHFRLGMRGTVSVLRDVTDLRHAAEQLKEHAARLQAKEEEIRLERDRVDLILETVPNPIIVVDNDNQIIRMNRQASRLFHPAPDDAPSGGRSRRAAIALSNDTRFTSFLSQLRLEPGPVKSGEVALVDPETEEGLAMWVTAAEMRDAVGAVAATVAVMQDLAPLRELERARVEQALFESEKLAATGRLAASIAHEINNPLEVIKNALYLLVQRTPEHDPNYRFLQLAQNETERMSRILRDMLGFYRPVTTMQPTGINALIEEAELLLRGPLRQAGVRVENDFGPLPPVMASRDQLKQVILNLLLNAQQAMPGGGTIYVCTRAARAGDGADVSDVRTVQITIRDTGVGIPEEHLPHIFEPFFSTKAEQKGTGLGLWVSYGIIRNHGGTIRVRSRPGQGTTFTISLPTGGPPADGQR